MVFLLEDLFLKDLFSRQTQGKWWFPISLSPSCHFSDGLKVLGTQAPPTSLVPWINDSLPPNHHHRPFWIRQKTTPKSNGSWGRCEHSIFVDEVPKMEIHTCLWLVGMFFVFCWFMPCGILVWLFFGTYPAMPEMTQSWKAPFTVPKTRSRATFWP